MATLESRRRAGAVSVSKCDDNSSTSTTEQSPNVDKSESLHENSVLAVASEVVLQSGAGGDQCTVLNAAPETGVVSYENCFVGEIPEEYLCGICSKVKTNKIMCIKFYTCL